MPRCRHCQHEVIHTVGPDNQPVLLDAHVRVWTSLTDAHLFPANGDTVRETRGLAEHAPVCAAVREGEARARARQQAARPRQAPEG